MEEFINVAISSFIYLIIGICISFFLSKNDIDKFNCSKVFIFSFIIYSLYALNVYLAYVARGSIFISPDEYHFYSISESLGRYSDIFSIFRDCFIDRIHIENEGAHFYRGALAYFANNFLIENSVLLQYMNSAFIASLSQIFIYKILRTYISSIYSYKYIIIYVLFSFVILSGGKLTRDVYINFLFSIGLYLTLTEFNIKRLIYLLIVVLITIQFRLEHGLFMIFMPIVYIYEQARHNVKYKYLRYLFIILALIVLFLLSALLIKYIDAIRSTMEGYVEYTRNSAEHGGLGKYILRLPVGLKQVFTVIYSQISPFPAWYGISDSSDIYELLSEILEMFSPVFWFIVSYSVFFAILKNWKSLERIDKLLLIVYIVFLFFNSANMNPRRLVCMYPIPYLFYVKYYCNCLRKTHIKKALIVYVVLCLIYIILKV